MYEVEGYVKLIGKLGVVVVISGLGVINVIIGIVDVMSDSVFFLVFIG